MSHLSSAPFLPTAEQRRLVVAWRAGDAQARERLIVGLIPSVKLRVQYFAGRKPMDPELREDLICEGTVGLVQGLEKYDVSRLDDTAPWSYAAHWVDLRIREAMVRLIPPVSYRNYMAWWRTGSARRLEPGESFDVARDENDELLARRIPSHQRSADDILEDAERPAEAWAELREAVPQVPAEEWDLFSLRVLHRLTPAQVAERYARTWPYWRENDVDRVTKRVLGLLLVSHGQDASPAALLSRFRKLVPEEDAPDAPPPPAPTSLRVWFLTPSPEAPQKKRR
jgi:RNA polymerase sigma factor (sigma-70 family)